MGFYAANHLREHAEKCRRAAEVSENPEVAECLRQFASVVSEQAAKLEVLAAELGIDIPIPVIHRHSAK